MLIRTVIYVKHISAFSHRQCIYFSQLAIIFGFTYIKKLNKTCKVFTLNNNANYYIVYNDIFLFTDIADKMSKSFLLKIQHP